MLKKFQNGVQISFVYNSRKKFDFIMGLAGIATIRLFLPDA